MPMANNDKRPACGVAVWLPESKPVIVDAETLLNLIEEIGVICVTDGLNVGVGVLTTAH